MSMEAQNGAFVAQKKGGYGMRICKEQRAKNKEQRTQASSLDPAKLSSVGGPENEKDHEALPISIFTRYPTCGFEWAIVKGHLNTPQYNLDRTLSRRPVSERLEANSVA